MAESSTLTNDLAVSKKILQEVEEKLKCTKANDLDIAYMRREFFRTAGEIALITNEDIAKEFFDKAIEVAQKMVEDAPSTSNRFYLDELRRKVNF